jgi:toxin-antitoxin system PIN domain toxin
MNTLNFLDANVWLALLWERHEHADRAREWFRGCDDEQFLFCRFTQITVLRLLTTKQVMGRDVKSMAGAWEVWDQLWSDDRIAMLPEPDGLEPRLRIHSRLGSASPKVWADAYLVAFASVAGLKLVTFDRALESRPVEVLVL